MAPLAVIRGSPAARTRVAAAAQQRHAPCCPVRRLSRPGRRTLSVCAAANLPEGESRNSPVPGDLLASMKQSCDKFLHKYDFLSTGLGALTVTTYCVVRGQSPSTAAGITVVATVVALVANEMLFNNDCQQ